MANILPASPGVRDCTFRLIGNAQRFRSPLSGVGQTVARKGDFWAASLTLPPLTRAQAREWAGLVGRLVSLRETVLVGPPVIQSDLAHLSGALVYQAGETGTFLRIDNIAVGAEVPAGAFLAFDTPATATAPSFRSLHMVTTTQVKSSSPSLALPIVPAIRVSPADNAPVDFLTPTCEMEWEAAGADLLTLQAAASYGLTLSLIEKVRA